MTEKRRTQIKKLAHLDRLKELISDEETVRHLDSFKGKLDFARYYIEKYEEGKRDFNTDSQQHDIALIFKANAEATIFIFKSSLDCLANALKRICNLKIDKVYFNKGLAKCLKNNDCGVIAQIVNDFMDENDYFFKLRNLITHNVVVSAKYSLKLPSKEIEMAFQALPAAKIRPIA